MLFDIWNRATAKWRGIVVYALLQAATRFVTSVISYKADTAGWKLYAAGVSIAVSLFTITRMWQLLTADAEGDEEWPPIWS